MKQGRTECFLVAQQRGQKGQMRKFCHLAPTFSFICCFLVPFPFLRNACLCDTQLHLCLVITLLFKRQDGMKHVGERKTSKVKMKQGPECSSSELLSKKILKKKKPKQTITTKNHPHLLPCCVMFIVMAIYVVSYVSFCNLGCNDLCLQTQMQCSSLC